MTVAKKVDLDSSGHVSRVGEGLASVSSVLQCLDVRHIRSLCLHGNSITSCQGLDGLCNVTELNLSANYISALRGLAALPELCTLNLASNRLKSLDDLPCLPKLKRFSCAHNAVSSLRGMSSLKGSPLGSLDLRNNCIAQLKELAVLSPLAGLSQIRISGGSHPNPISQLPGLLPALATALPQV
jgi:Leucine-rich repeat (LRR) protein